MAGQTDARALVTGGSGFFGRCVRAELEEQGFEAVATAHRVSERTERALDVTDRAAAERVLAAERPGVVVNCAAYGVDFNDQDPANAVSVNLLGALGLLEAAAASGVVRFVQVGSCFEYGSRDGAITEDAPLSPFGIYGATKAAASLLLAERARSLGLSLLIVRPFGMWGPGERPSRLVPQIVRACRRGEPLDLTPCDVLRDYTYVEDMARKLVALLGSEDWASHPIVNLGSGEPVLLRDFVLGIASQLGGVELMRFGRLPHRQGELRSLVADVSLFERLVGDTAVTPFEEGLRRMEAPV